MSVCTDIKRVEKIDDITDIMLVTIDDEIKAYMIYSYTESLKFLNQEVLVSYRKDIYQGRIETFINTLTIPTRVTTLDRENNIKLFCDINDNNSNVCFADMQIGETFIGAIMYCVDCKYESSNKAVWMTLIARDKAGKVASIRLFDYSTEGLVYNGIYVRADIKKTKYGFNTEMITPMELDFPLNPEIEIARKYVTNYFAEDKFMQSVFEKTHLLEHMENYISIEKGYELVRLAVQLDILGELKNTLDDVNFKALAYALTCRHGYITKSQMTDYSAELRTIVFSLQCGLPADVAVLVMRLVDTTADNHPKEKDIYDKIIMLSDAVIRAKKEAK